MAKNGLATRSPAKRSDMSSDIYDQTTSQLQNIHVSMAASMANAHDHFLNAIFVMPVLNPN